MNFIIFERDKPDQLLKALHDHLAQRVQRVERQAAQETRKEARERCLASAHALRDIRDYLHDLVIQETVGGQRERAWDIKGLL